MSPIRAQFVRTAAGVPGPGAQPLPVSAVGQAISGQAPAPQQAPDSGGSVIEGSGFNPLAAGHKAYGGGRPYPNAGKTRDIGGYGARDARRQVQMDALKRRVGGIQ